MVKKCAGLSLYAVPENKENKDTNCVCKANYKHVDPVFSLLVYLGVVKSICADGVDNAEHTKEKEEAEDKAKCISLEYAECQDIISEICKEKIICNPQNAETKYPEPNLPSAARSLLLSVFV